MPEIPASEYLSSLLVAYQNAGKFYSQAVSDVVAAEIRRDEAKMTNDEALVRLEAARAKYLNNGNSSGGSLKHNEPRRKSQDDGINMSMSKQGSRRGAGTKKKPTSPFKAKEEEIEAPATPLPTRDTSDILLSPRAGSKKAPKIFTGDGQQARRRSSKVGPLSSLPKTSSVLGIARGRTRDWYDKNFDCEVAGLVKKFYQAAFGTKTHERTHKVTVRTIVLNDEWNDLVSDTSQIQEMYIGKNTEKDAKPNLRDRAAEALVSPPQKEPIALFFAPKNASGTSEIFYGGHWRVVDGKMLNPPRSVKGQPRQCLAKFEFAGVDPVIVESLNKTII